MKSVLGISRDHYLRKPHYHSSRKPKVGNKWEIPLSPHPSGFERFHKRKSPLHSSWSAGAASWPLGRWFLVAGLLPGSVGELTSGCHPAHTVCPSGLQRARRVAVFSGGCGRETARTCAFGMGWGVNVNRVSKCIETASNGPGTPILRSVRLRKRIGGT